MTGADVRPLATVTELVGALVVGNAPKGARGVGPGKDAKGVRRAARAPTPLVGSLPLGLEAAGAQVVAGDGETGQLWEWPSFRPRLCLPLESKVGLRGSTIDRERSRAN